MHRLTRRRKAEMARESAEGSLAVLPGDSESISLFLTCCTVLFMQCGFGLLETGSVKNENANIVLIRYLSCVGICAFVYYACGYAFGFGAGNLFIGYDHFFLINLPDDQLSHWMTQFVFAVATATIVAGAVAGRMQFIAFCVYTFVIAGFVYPIVTHWAWSEEGWLTHDAPGVDLNYEDFAGSGVVHVVGGAAGLVGSAVIGPRLGRFQREKTPPAIPEQSSLFTSVGGILSTIGMFALNGGARPHPSETVDGAAAPLVFVNTLLSGCAASVTALILKKIQPGRHYQQSSSLLVAINGALTGMVAMSAGCNVMEPWCAIITGLVAGPTYFAWSKLIFTLKVDDPIDAVPVHLGGGLWGVCAVSLLTRDGVIFAFNAQAWRSLGWNATGGFAIMAWSMAVSLAVFGSLHLCRRLRITMKLELRGLHVNVGKEPIYIGSNYGLKWGTNMSDHYELELVHINYIKDNVQLDNRISDNNSVEDTTPQNGTMCTTKDTPGVNGIAQTVH